MKSSQRKIFDWKLKASVDISEIERLEKFCQQFRTQLSGQEIILLNGPLAAGKSQFVRLMIQLIIQEGVTSSPSYALHHQYSGGSQVVDHWDLYRLGTEDELESVGFWEQLQNKNIIFIEWSNRLKEEWLPKDRILLRIEFHFDQIKRTIEVYQAA